MMEWSIYHGSREYAREHGDPLLGTVEADTKAEAERIARSRGIGGTAGVWATQANLPAVLVNSTTEVTQ